MADKRSYRDLVIRVDANVDDIKEDIKGIYKELKSQNGRIFKNEINTAVNTNGIRLIWKVGGWVGGSVFGGGVITIIVCRVLGVF